MNSYQCRKHLIEYQSQNIHLKQNKQKRNQILKQIKNFLAQSHFKKFFFRKIKKIIRRIECISKSKFLLSLEQCLERR